MSIMQPDTAFSKNQNAKSRKIEQRQKTKLIVRNCSPTKKKIYIEARTMRRYRIRSVYGGRKIGQKRSKLYI